MGSFYSLNLGKIWDCRSFSDLNTVTGSRHKEVLKKTTVSLSEPSVNQTLELRPI